MNWNIVYAFGYNSCFLVYWKFRKTVSTQANSSRVFSYTPVLFRILLTLLFRSEMKTPPSVGVAEEWVCVCRWLHAWNLGFLFNGFISRKLTPCKMQASNSKPGSTHAFSLPFKWNVYIHLLCHVITLIIQNQELVWLLNHIIHHYRAGSLDLYKKRYLG